MDEDREGQRGFTVKDRRRFSETGDVRESEAAPSSQPTVIPPSPERRAESPPERASVPPPSEASEPVTFSTFVLGLSTQALLHLGEIPNPVTSAVEPDLEAAKQVIDILGMLRDKTRNNLEPGEESLLDSVLYDLRMRYVELVRKQPKEGT